MEHRICYKCKVSYVLNESNFYKHKREKTGYDFQCKTCSKNSAKKRIKDKREKGLRTKKTITNDTKGYVYIMKCCSYYKIGLTKSNDVNKRLKHLQIGNPFDINIIYVLYTEDRFLLESNIHRSLKKYHVKGEWYKCDIEIIKSLL